MISKSETSPAQQCRARVLTSHMVVMRCEGEYHTLVVPDGAKVLALLERKQVEAVVLNRDVQGESGEELLASITRKHPHIPVITLYSEDVAKLSDRDVPRPSVTPHGSSPHPHTFVDFITSSPEVLALFDYAKFVAVTAQPVMILGETGVGKELLASNIHALRGHKGRFVSINVAGLDDTLFSDALFGHKRGAFTSADRPREGLITQAQNGTLFLDEIGDLEIASQVKLLRVLQEGEYYPLGGDQPRSTNARVMVSTHRDLIALQASGHFRPDLYFRLNTHCLEIPPLRKRLKDIPLLLDHFLEKAAQSQEIRKPTINDSLPTLLSTYHFPGNVRELEGMVFDAVAQHRGGILSMASFRRTIRRQIRFGLPGESNPDQTSDVVLEIRQDTPMPLLRSVERNLIHEVMRRTEGNQTLAAEMLGISRHTLQARLKQYEATPLPRPYPDKRL